MKVFVFLFFTLFLCQAAVSAQVTLPAPIATEILQPSQSPALAGSTAKIDAPVEPVPSATPQDPVPLRIPAGTEIEVEAAYTVNSLNVKVGDVLSFRVLIPIMVDGVTVIEKDALVTARVTLSKRGGHWGKAGKLSWVMEDVIAANNARVLLDPITRTRNEALWNLERKTKGGKPANSEGHGSVKGTSHTGQVTTRTIVAAAIFPPLAPLALMNGFKRGENAVLPEGKRFVVSVRNETNITLPPKN